MNTVLSRGTCVKRFGGKSLGFQFKEYYADKELAEEEILSLAIQQYPRSFGVYFLEDFSGPFSPEDFQPGNFILNAEGINDLLCFYKSLPPELVPTKEENPLISFDEYLDQFVLQHKNNTGNFYVFKYNYNKIDTTIQFNREYNRYSYFYLFVIIEPKKIFIGRLWHSR
jgi:hypothetical protein